MSQIKWSDLNHSVTTGWDATTQRFHLTIEDAPTGEVEFDCLLMHGDQQPQWVLDALDERQIERPAILYMLLFAHREANSNEVVCHVHHAAEHEKLGEPECKPSAFVLDMKNWVRFAPFEEDEDFGDGASIAHVQVNNDWVAGIITNVNDPDSAGVIWGDGYGWHDCESVTDARAWIAEHAVELHDGLPIPGDRSH